LFPRIHIRIYPLFFVVKLLVAVGKTWKFDYSRCLEFNVIAKWNILLDTRNFCIYHLIPSRRRISFPGNNRKAK
jgi:hypothetical protein